jgi:hypothetical protein
MLAENIEPKAYSISSAGESTDLLRMWPEPPALEPSPALSCMPVEELVLMRNSQTGEVIDMPRVPDCRRAVEWLLERRPDAS